MSIGYDRQSDLPYPQPWEYVLDNIFNREKGLMYIDVGANDGLVVSNTAFMELNLNWNGICIEPHPYAFSRLEKNRNCKKYNACISDDIQEYLSFYEVKGYPEMLSCIESACSQEHLERIKSEIQRYGGEVNLIKVKSIQLNTILEENNIDKVDYLSIDTEGSELSVLKSVDLNKYPIRVISAESNNTDVKKYLVDKEYRFITNVCNDDIFVKDTI